jgi:drug/metabolite transporter (DMT)-like permease
VIILRHGRTCSGHPRLSCKPIGNACVTNNNTRPLDAIAALIMLGLTLSWGLNQVSIKLALPEIPPFIQATIRSVGAFIVILIWARWRNVSLTWRDGTLAGGLLAGVLFAVEFLLIFPGLQLTAASRATLFIYTAPFFVALGSGFLLGEKLRAMQWLGLLCSFAGLVVAFGIPDVSRDGRQLIGDIMMVGAGAAWGATTLIIKASKLRSAPSEKVLAYQLGVSIPLLALGALLMGERTATMPGAVSLSWLAYQTFWVVSLTYAVWFAMVQRYSASRLSAFTFLTPLFGVVSGHFVLGEPISWAFAAAVALVIGGLILVNRPG